MERKVMIFEYSIYTDKDCTNPFREGYESKKSSYLEPELCEYEKRDWDNDIIEIRRVFDFDDNGKKELMDLINFLDENNTSSDDFTAIHLHSFYEDMKNDAKYVFNEFSTHANDCIDSDYELAYELKVITTSAEKIN